MKRILRLISPRRAVQDFAGQWQQPTPHRWQILGVACAATFSLFMLLVPGSERQVPERPELIFITTLDESRTEGEIIADNCANEVLKDEMQALIDARDERRREMYRVLGRATFVDVDAMEAEIEAERAATGEPEGPSEAELALSVEEYCSRATG